MRRILLLGAALLALLVPTVAFAAETKVEVNDEAVGSVRSAGSGRWVVENLDYAHEATIKRSTSSALNFYDPDHNSPYATAKRLNSTIWTVQSESNPNHRIATIQKVGKNRWRTYDADQRALGQATGSAALEGAAAVALVFLDD